jgi:sugar (pentulose or hexulose) kinase
MRIFADMYGVKTVRNEINGAAALGSAICVAVATGLYDGFNEAVNNMVKQKDEFIPNADNHKIYNKMNSEAYRNLPKLMEETLKTVYGACN